MNGCMAARAALPLLLVACTLGLAVNVNAVAAHPDVVSPVPSATTPHAVDGGAVANAAVNTLTQVGSTMYAGGRINRVQDPSRKRLLQRHNLFSFDVATGSPTGWAPRVNGEVWRTLYVAPYLYVGGSFTSANGVRGHLVRYRLDSRTPVIDATWSAQRVSAPVTDLDYVGGRLLVAGSFRKRLVALDPATGRDTGYLSLGISGTVKLNGAGPTQVYRIAVSPDGSRLIGIGNFTTVGGVPRARAFMADLGPERATVASWYYRPLQNRCASLPLAAQLRDVAFSPAGGFFVMAATGGVPAGARAIGRDICDAAARFETDVPDPTRPTWINYTGGDTLHSVTVTGAAVYVGGHQRWMNNPYGRGYAGRGAVVRPGIAALSRATGGALAWNPTKTRGVGTKFLYPTRAGLWYGSDGRRFAGLVRDSIAFTPLG